MAFHSFHAALFLHSLSPDCFVRCTWQMSSPEDCPSTHTSPLVARLALALVQMEEPNAPSIYVHFRDGYWPSLSRTSEKNVLTLTTTFSARAVMLIQAVIYLRLLFLSCFVAFFFVCILSFWRQTGTSPSWHMTLSFGVLVAFFY